MVYSSPELAVGLPVTLMDAETNLFAEYHFTIVLKLKRGENLQVRYVWIVAFSCEGQRSETAEEGMLCPKSRTILF